MLLPGERPGLFGCLSNYGAWSLQSWADLQSWRFMLQDNGSAILNIQLMCVLGSLLRALVSFSLPSWVEILRRYLWKRSIKFGRGPAEFSATQLPQNLKHAGTLVLLVKRWAGFGENQTESETIKGESIEKMRLREVTEPAWGLVDLWPPKLS